MSPILTNHSLKAYNTFGINALAKYFAVFNTIEDLEVILNEYSQPQLPCILGGGSNILLTGNIDRLVLHNQIMHRSIVAENEDAITVKVGAGENWHNFVLWCIGNGWGGVENLSLIPGSVGASPIQNIGAYGVEVKDVITSVAAYHLTEKKHYQFSNADCAFGYRDSIFKQALKGAFVITDVNFTLTKKPVFHTNYGAITAQLAAMQVKDLTLSAISEAVINIRKSKLPDPSITGNAGSFFKNPVVSEATHQTLAANYPTLPAYPQGNDTVKIAAGWLIEMAGWKGKRLGNVGVHHQQALVLINYGHANGFDIKHLAMLIQNDVIAKFGIALETEVNFW